MRIALYQHIEKILSDKKIYLTTLIDDLRSSNNDTKSSMGDKYETSREMLQQEIDRIQGQFNEVEKQEAVFKTIQTKDYKKIGLGAEVKTSLGHFCIAFGLGAVTLETENIFVLSPNAPVAKAMEGKTTGDSLQVNGQTYTILELH